MKKHRIKIFYPMLISVVVFIIYLILDYINITGVFGINNERINIEVLNIFINSLVVITLFAITYLTIDANTALRMVNQEKTAKTLLKEAYIVCSKNIELLENEKIKKSIVAKVNFNTSFYKNEVVVYMRDQPFVYENKIITLATEGIISPYDFETYLRIKNLYQEYLTIAITFFDRPDLTDPFRKELHEKLRKTNRWKITIISSF